MERLRLAFFGVALITAIASFAQTGEHPSIKSLYHKTVTWNAGKNPVPWKGLASATSNQKYHVSLIPLWAVEGGIVAIEISLSDSQKPNYNLLGERNEEPQPFVVTVEELEAGVDKSKFGSTRVFTIGERKLEARIKDSRLGRGVGGCETCVNIQALTVEFTLQ